MWKDVVTIIYMTTLAIMDIRECKVPIWLLGVGGVGSLIIGIGERLCLRGMLIEGISEMFLGMLPGCFLLLMAYLTQKAGYADGVVLLQLGCIYGYALGWAFFCISLLLLSAISMILLAGKKIKKDSEMPYIPFLAITVAGYVMLGG